MTCWLQVKSLNSTPLMKRRRLSMLFEIKLSSRAKLTLVIILTAGTGTLIKSSKNCICHSAFHQSVNHSEEELDSFQPW